MLPCNLARYQHISGKLRMPYVVEYWVNIYAKNSSEVLLSCFELARTKFDDKNQRFSISLFTTPSAVHLTTCFMSDSQHLRLSVLASLPLSPLQRFNYYIKKDVIPITCMCQEFLCIQQFPLQFTYPSYFLLYSSCLRSNSRFFSMSARYSSLV